MRRYLAVAVVLLATFAMLAPPALAQAPAPKVTITGFIDHMTTVGANHFDGNYSRTSDKEWYARTRFRPDFIFEVGSVKTVLGIEVDISYGQGGVNDGGFPGNVTGTNGGAKPAANGSFDLNTDVGGMMEIKWLYTEFNLTGKDGLLPFIPVQTVARVGAQPFGSLGNYKITWATGDWAGISAVTSWTPALKTNLAFVMVEDEIAPGNRGAAGAKPTRGDDIAVIFSPEYTPFKGLDLKPVYSLFYAEGVTNGNARRNATNRFSAGAGNLINAAGSYGIRYAGGGPDYHEARHTVGIDARWRSGNFYLDPTIFYQFGSRDNQCVCPVNGSPFVSRKVEADMSAWFFDIQSGYQWGPLLLEGRFVYSTGNSARDNLSKSVRYFEVLDVDTSYWAGWSQIWALGVDYFIGGGGSNGGMDTNIGYDRYGRLGFGLRATYNITPNLSPYLVVSPQWTAQQVDTHTGTNGFTRTIIDDRSFVKGDSSYLGTEADLGLTWRFHPTTVFDLVGAYLFAGGALDTTEILNGTATKRDAKDAWTVTSRIRFSW